MLSGKMLASSKTQSVAPPAEGWDIENATALSKNQNFSVSGQDTNASGLYFKPDGTKVYIVGTTSDRVYQYSLATAWDITTATYDSKSFLVSGQDNTPVGLSFKADGTKMYVLGDTSNKIYEYNLSTAWDVTTATYVFVSFSTTSYPFDMYFKPDGTGVYVTDYVANTIYQYTLGTAWNINTAGFTRSFSYSAQSITYAAVTFNSAGTRMYLMSQTSTQIYQYTLSTAWNISTAVYAGRSISLGGGLIGGASGLAFNADETVLYLVDPNSSDKIWQYPLLNAGDILSISDNSLGLRFLVELQETSPTGLFFKPDGTQMYMVGLTSDTVYQYSLSEAWNTVTATYTGKSLSISAQETLPYAVCFKDDGSKMYLLGRSSDRVFQYSLATAWDLSTASYDSVSFLVSGQEINSSALYFKPDGTKFYIVGVSSDTVYQYSLSSAWDVSTASYDSKSFSVTTQETSPTGLFFKPDGTKMYVIGSANNDVFQYSLSTAWDASTASYDSIVLLLSGSTGGSGGLFFTPTGDKFYLCSQSNSLINQFIFPVEWDLSTANQFPNGMGAYYNVADIREESTPMSVQFSTDGTQMYMVGQTSDKVFQYILLTAWDVSTALYSYKNFSTASQEGTITAMYFKSDGTKMYVIGTVNDTVYQYTLSTAWDISTASYDSISFSVASEEINPVGLSFSSDGTKMYVLGTTGDDINQYSLSTAWDVSSAVFDSVTFSISAQAGTTPSSMYFRPNGSQVFVLSQTNGSVFQYSLTSAWDISTASYDNISYNMSIFTTTPRGLSFKTDGTRMYMIENVNDFVYQFDTTAA